MWSSSTKVTEREVEAAVRRVNRRIQAGGMLNAKDAQCLEQDWTFNPNDAQTPSAIGTAADGMSGSGHERGPGRGSTLIFLHGFADAAKHWRELTELLVRGVRGRGLHRYALDQVFVAPCSLSHVCAPPPHLSAQTLLPSNPKP